MITTTKIVRAAAIGFLTVGLASGAVAQTTTESPARSGTTTTTSEARGENRSEGNWGWIGLLGLAGLAGLMRRKDERPRESQAFGAASR
jgi:MYXO-CTERM domain-containing protein